MSNNKTARKHQYAVYMNDAENEEFLLLIQKVNESLGTQLGFSDLLKLLVNNKCKEIGIKG